MKKLRLPNQEAAQEFFNEYEEDLMEVFRGGWIGWINRDKKEAAILKERTRANIIYDYMEREARRRFGNGNKPGVHVIESNGLFFLNFNDEVAVRFKKLDSENRPSNVRTLQQFDLANQKLELPGMPPSVQPCTIGYRLNENQTEIQNVTMSCWKSETERVWSWHILKVADGQLFFKEMGESTAPQETEKPPTPRVRPKSKSTDKRGKRNG